MSERSSSRPGGPCDEAGFTLIELLVVIAIIAILIALQLPAVQSVRQNENAQRALSDPLRSVLEASNRFVEEAGRPPGSFAELEDFCERFPRLCDLHLTLPGGQIHGYAYDPAPGGVWVVEPVAPGLTGSQTFVCDPRRAADPEQALDCTGSVRQALPTPGAEESRARALRSSLGHGARLIGRLLAENPEALAAVRDGGLPPAREAWRELDVDGDGSVRLAEVFGWRVDEDPRISGFLSQVAGELRLGAGGEDAASMQLPAVEGTPEAPAFDYDTLQTLTRDAVRNRRARAWLVFWLRYAEWAQQRGDVGRETFAVVRYLRRLEPELLRSVTLADGTALAQILRGTSTERPPAATR